MPRCSEPAEAVTVIEDVTGCELLVDEPVPPLDPQPLSPGTLKASASRTSDRICQRLPLRQKNKPQVRLSTIGENAHGRISETAADCGVESVRVVKTGDEDGVTVAGEKLHVAPAGNPVQANETAALNPFAGVMVIAAVTSCPRLTVKDAGDAVMVKSGAGKLMV